MRGLKTLNGMKCGLFNDRKEALDNKFGMTRKIRTHQYGGRSDFAGSFT
jgi:hypothetical protein